MEHLNSFSISIQFLRRVRQRWDSAMPARSGEPKLMIKTQEERRSDMVDALEALDDAEREGKLLSRSTIAMLYANVAETVSAYNATC
jgi:hypothetical protein